MQRRVNPFEATISVVMYSLCSISMIILNKLLMHTYEMSYPNSLLFVQNSGALLLVMAAKHWSFATYPSFELQVARRWVPLTLLFVLMLFSSMKSLYSMSVSAQTMIKNLAIIVTAVGDSFLYGKEVTLGMYLAFCLMVAGSYLGAMGDPWVTAEGMFWTFTNILATVGYSLYMKQLMGDVGESIGRYGPVFYNNLLSLPFFFVAAMGEVESFLGVLASSTWAAKLCLIIVTLNSSGMTFAVFWCMQMTSPTTFSVVGVLNKVPITILGIFVFQQFPEFMGYVGIILALGGGFLYSVINVRNNKLAEKQVSRLHRTRAFEGEAMNAKELV